MGRIGILAKLKTEIDKLMNENDKHIAHAGYGYDKGYVHGFHDALVDVMIRMGIETDEEYYS